MEQSQRNLDVTTSSMDVMALNNLVVSMRSLVKQSRVQIINKLTHQIRRYRKKKGSEEQVAKFQKKADRLKSEIDALKHINLDQAAKNALACTVSFEEAAKEGNMERRAIARLASHKLLQPKVEKFRKEHDDWKALAAFLLSKNTGRRFKKKKTPKNPANEGSAGIGKKQTEHTDSGSESADESEPEELEAEESDGEDNPDSADDGRVSSEAPLSRPEGSSSLKTHTDPCPDSDDSQDDLVVSPCVTTTVLPSTSECRKAKPKIAAPLHETSRTKQEDNKQLAVMSSNQTAAGAAVEVLKDMKSAKQEKLKKNPIAKPAKNVTTTQASREMVVQTLNLDELNSESDIVVRSNVTVAKQNEDLSFLYRAAGGNESFTKKPKKKVKDPFFVCESGSEGNDSSSEDGDSGSEGIAGETETQSLGRKISKNMVQSSFVETLSRGSSSRIREKQVSSRRMHEEKQGKPNVGGKTFHHPNKPVGDRKHPPGKNVPRQSEDRTKGRPLHSGGATATRQPVKEPETKLHPSWEASKKRKQQVAGVTAFCGKKIKFDDDDS